MAVMSAEAAVLHAIIEDDRDRAIELLRDFLPGELRALRQSLQKLDAAIADELGDGVAPRKRLHR